MRFGSAVLLLVANASIGDGLVHQQPRTFVARSTTLYNTVVEAELNIILDEAVEPKLEVVPASVITGSITGADIKARLEATLAKLRIKDAASPKLSKKDLKIVYEDDHLIVVDKPSGLLSVKGKSDGGSLAEAVHDAVGCEMPADRMVVHRLGMDTSGLMILAKTTEAVRGLNTVFRTRKIERKYEALVAGHIDKPQGFIDLPLMRDYEFPPFMRISTDEHQQALVGLSHEEVGKKLLDAPKSSLTKYEVIAREELGGQPVTRVSLTSISGRTHQLNVHLAAFGHPIVGDTTYGVNGMAAPNGGLSANDLPENKNRASVELQMELNELATGKVFIHAKSVKFQHPTTAEEISLSTNPPF